MKKGDKFSWKDMDILCHRDFVTRWHTTSTVENFYGICYIDGVYYDFRWETKSEKIKKVKILDREELQKKYGIGLLPGKEPIEKTYGISPIKKLMEIHKPKKIKRRTDNK